MGKSSCSSLASSAANRSNTSLTTSTGRASARSTLLITTMGLRPILSAFDTTNLVCGSGPSAASTRTSAPSTMLRMRSTSPPKSAWPGVSTMLMRVSFQRIEVALARMVMPRSRSRSLESSARSATRWFSRKAPDCCSSRSTRVVLPWSTCAMMATLRRFMNGPENQSRAARARICRQYSDAATGRNAQSAPTGATGMEPVGHKKRDNYNKVAAGHPLARERRRRDHGATHQGVRVRSPVAVTNQRRVLCVFPHYTPAFGTFNHAYRLMKGVRAFMPPQGLLLIAAYMPEGWPVRFVDENIERATAADFEWADVVVVSGMHVQAGQIHDIAARAHAAGKPVMLGGPSPSASPDMYPEIDYLHCGEMGDATDEIIARLDQSAARPPAQMRFTTKERLPLQDFPIPAYDLIPLRHYLMLTIQFSSGCPYLCEFCDIPGLYGRQPRLKTPQQITAELDAMRKQPHPPVVYFVDDNFVGNRKAAKDMLPVLVEWQKQHHYPLQFACEATLNIAKQPEILRLMREASFLGLFVGIETPEADALKAMRKDQNNAVPMMASIKTLNDYGLEVT